MGRFVGLIAKEISLGPLALAGRSKLACILLLIFVVLLTLLTQVGGVILWLTLPLFARIYARLRHRGRMTAVTSVTIGFVAIYVAVGQTIIPSLASQLGRDALPCFASDDRRYGPSSLLYCLTNRHYATPPVHDLLAELADHLEKTYPGSVISYLDAGFPFIDGFPLPPHLSHHDGRKIDIAFFYKDARTKAPIARAGAWSIGYWAYTPPRAGEPQPCARATPFLSLRWDFDWLQPMFAGIELDEVRTRAMLNWLQSNAVRRKIGKILLEPHIKTRLGLDGPLIRFQGCRAARHDDHIHLQIR